MKKYTFSYSVKTTEKVLAYKNWWYRLFRLKTVQVDKIKWQRKHAQLELSDNYNLSDQFYFTLDVIRAIEPTACRFQLEKGDFPTSYIPTTSIPVTRPCDIYGVTDPRVVDGSMLIEPQRTNLLKYSK